MEVRVPAEALAGTYTFRALRFLLRHLIPLTVFAAALFDSEGALPQTMSVI